MEIIEEEAKQEFPFESWEIKAWLSKDNYMEYIMEKQAIELMKWFVKWFGE